VFKWSLNEEAGVQHKCNVLRVGRSIMMLNLPSFFCEATLKRVKCWRRGQAVGVRKVERESEFAKVTYLSCRILRVGKAEAEGGLR
jgi:hypothetical protein